MEGLQWLARTGGCASDGLGWTRSEFGLGWIRSAGRWCRRRGSMDGLRDGLGTDGGGVMVY